jgi:hypothetical protein
MQYHSGPANLSTFTDMDYMQESTNNFKTDKNTMQITKIHAGDSSLRRTRVAAHTEVNANGVDIGPTVSGLPQLTVENATCPVHVPKWH